MFHKTTIQYSSIDFGHLDSQENCFNRSFLFECKLIFTDQYSFLTCCKPKKKTLWSFAFLKYDSDSPLLVSSPKPYHEHQNLIRDLVSGKQIGLLAFLFPLFPYSKWRRRDLNPSTLFHGNFFWKHFHEKIGQYYNLLAYLIRLFFNKRLFYWSIYIIFLIKGLYFWVSFISLFFTTSQLVIINVSTKG